MPRRVTEAADSLGVAASCVTVGSPAGGAATRPVGRRLGPFRGDDLGELGREQVRVGADQVEELVFDGPRGRAAGGGWGEHDRPHRVRR
jgi:hypothetical protein